jgi:magnesium chelatase family protein
MLAKVFSFGLLGIEAFPIEIEVDVSRGLPAVTLVGLADTAIRESKERVKSAIKNSGFNWPDERITISLAPSDIKKEGTSFDLAIAIGILAATGQLNSQNLKDYCLLGELSLDGAIRHCRGILPISMAVTKSLPDRQAGKIKNLIVPLNNAKEAALVPEASVFALKTLRVSLIITLTSKKLRVNIQLRGL